MAQSVDPARLSDHIKVLASDAFEGRGPGTPGEAKAIAYIAEQFKADGLSPAGDRGGWTQAVTLRSFHPVGEVRTAFNIGGRLRPLKWLDEIVVRTMLPIPRVSVKDAPLVFVGYGVSAPERHWDDFKGVDLHGKIAVVLVNDPDFELGARRRPVRPVRRQGGDLLRPLDLQVRGDGPPGRGRGADRPRDRARRPMAGRRCATPTAIRNSTWSATTRPRPTPRSRAGSSATSPWPCSRPPAWTSKPRRSAPGPRRSPR